MSRRFVKLEKFALALVTVCALADVSFISYEESPALQENIRLITEVSKQVSFADAVPGYIPYAGYAGYAAAY
jgi:hypothetical protein